MTTRRDFLKYSALLAGAASIPAAAATADDITKKWNSKKKPGFTMWQIPSHSNTIGNSYIFRTTKGKVIVMDGGFAEEANNLRGFVGALGNEVEAWFVSHPHDDHMGALKEILKNPQDLKIKSIYHSSLGAKVIDAEPQCAKSCRELYGLMGKSGCEITDIRKPGDTYTFDGMSLKVIGVANDEFLSNPYNNSSMIYRVWDKRKSIVFLGDAGVECGDKALNSPYGKDLDCEYIQMSHHGQQGCSRDFYRAIKFRVCLWPTPSWVWNNDQGKGFNTGILKTVETREWMKEIGIKEHHVTCEEGLWRLD